MTEDKERLEIIQFYKKRIEPFIAIFILAFIVVGCILLYQDNQLKKEISSNCGWQTEEYKCYCDKSIVDKIDAKLLNNESSLLKNISWDNLNSKV